MNIRRVSRSQLRRRRVLRAIGILAAMVAGALVGMAIAYGSALLGYALGVGIL